MTADFLLSIAIVSLSVALALTLAGGLRQWRKS
jgi:hypothetical protein